MPKSRPDLRRTATFAAFRQGGGGEGTQDVENLALDEDGSSRPRGEISNYYSSPPEGEKLTQSSDDPNSDGYNRQNYKNADECDRP